MYTILITEEVESMRYTGRAWEILKEEQEEGQDKPEKKFGHTPQVKEKYIKTVKVLEQTVEEIDLPKVIAAVNGLTLRKARGD